MLLESPGKIHTPFISPPSPVVRRALCAQLGSQPLSSFYQRWVPRCAWGQALSGGHMTWSESPEGTDVSLSRSVEAGGSVGRGIRHLSGFQKSVLGSCFS